MSRGEPLLDRSRLLAMPGGLLGLAGSLLGAEARAVAATVVALAVIADGAAELLGRRIVPLQRDRETPRTWTGGRPLAWSARNGSALGVGAGSRLGFSLWYVVPAAALLFGSPPAGAVLYAGYGFVRTAGAYGFMSLGRRQGDFETAVDLVLGWRDAVRRLCAAELLLVGLVTAWSVGL